MKMKSYIPIFVLALVLSPMLVLGQDAANGASVPLKQIARTEVPSQYRIIKPIHCDLEGRLHALAMHEGGSPIVIRFNGDPSPGQPLSITSFGEPGSMFDNPTRYSIYDYAPDSAGGLYAIAIQKNHTASIVHFSSRGLTTGMVHVERLTPKRLAVFADGNLLIFGLSTDQQAKNTGGSSSWVTEIVRPDGALLHQVPFDPRLLSWTPGPAIRQPPSAEEWEEIELHVDFHPSKDGNIYAALPNSVSSPSFGEQARVAIITPAGGLSFTDIPPTGAEFFGLVIGGERTLGLFGRRGTDSEPGRFDNLHEFAASNRQLQHLGQYSVQGAPECVSGSVLLVIRPDGKGEGGTSIVSYQLPISGGRGDE